MKHTKHRSARTLGDIPGALYLLIRRLKAPPAKATRRQKITAAVLTLAGIALGIYMVRLLRA